MSNPRKRLDFFLAVLLSSGQEDKKSAYEFVHCCDHSLSMRKAFLSFFVVVRLEDRVPIDATLSHEVDILPEAGVATLGDVPMPLALSGLVDAWIRSHERDELLVGGEAADVLYLCHELGCGNRADARHGGNDVDRFLMEAVLDVQERLGKCLVTSRAFHHFLGAVLNQDTMGGDSYGRVCKLPDPGDGCRMAASASDNTESGLKFFIAGFKDFLGTSEAAEKAQHGFGKYIQPKEFGKCDGEVPLEDGLCFGKLLGILLSSSGKDFALRVHVRPSPRKPHGRIRCIHGDGHGVKLVSLGLADRYSLLMLLDKHRVYDKSLPAVIQEPVVQRKVLLARGLHDKNVGFGNAVRSNESLESFAVHSELIVGGNEPSAAKNRIVGRPARYINSYDTHETTSRLRNGSPFPISRVNEAPWLNQPIGKIGTEDRLLSKFKDLDNMRSSVPEIYHFSSPYGEHITQYNTNYMVNYS